MTYSDGSLSSVPTAQVEDKIGIYTLDQLAAIDDDATSRSGDYILVVNTLNFDNLSGAGTWTPLCIGGDPFNGTFDGNGKTINLGNNRVTTKVDGTFFFAGLFDTIGLGTVKNLKLEGSIAVSESDPSANLVVGGLAAQVTNGGNVENVYSSVNITATSPNFSIVGGIVGDMNSGSILNCRSDGTITASGNVTGGAQVGGIAGQNHDTVQFCWSEVNITAPIVASNNTGGIVGIVRIASTSGILTNCVALNNTITGGNPSGRVFGSTEAGTTINSNFANAAMGNGSGGTLPTGTDSNENGVNVSTADANDINWWRTTAGWTTIHNNKSDASETSPWYLGGSPTRPRLWFE